MIVDQRIFCRAGFFNPQVCEPRDLLINKVVILQSNPLPAPQINATRGSQKGSSLLEIVMVFSIVMFVALAALCFVAPDKDQQSLAKEGSPTSNQSTIIDTRATNHQSSRSISNLESF